MTCKGLHDAVWCLTYRQLASCYPYLLLSFVAQCHIWLNQCCSATLCSASRSRYRSLQQPCSRRHSVRCQCLSEAWKTWSMSPCRSLFASSQILVKTVEHWVCLGGRHQQLQRMKSKACLRWIFAPCFDLLPIFIVNFGNADNFEVFLSIFIFNLPY